MQALVGYERLQFDFPAGTLERERNLIAVLTKIVLVSQDVLRTQMNATSLLDLAVRALSTALAEYEPCIRI